MCDLFPFTYSCPCEVNYNLYLSLFRILMTTVTVSAIPETSQKTFDFNINFNNKANSLFAFSPVWLHLLPKVTNYIF